MKKYLFLSLVLFNLVFAFGQKKGSVIIKFEQINNLYFNVDGTPYNSNETFVILYNLDFGPHELIISEKFNENILAQKLNLLVNDSMFFYILDKKYDQYELVPMYEMASNTKDLILKSGLNKEEPDTLKYKIHNCKLYTEFQFNAIWKMYLKSSDKNKMDIIKVNFVENCIYSIQLRQLLESTIDIKTRFNVFEYLYPKIVEKLDDSFYNQYFENTIYSSKVKKILQSS